MFSNTIVNIEHNMTDNILNNIEQYLNNINQFEEQF